MRKCRGRFWVYLARCRYGTYYAGYTANLERRLRLHNAGKGAKYLRGRLPAKLVYAKAYRSAAEAMRAEYALKQLTRAQKEELAGKKPRRR